MRDLRPGPLDTWTTVGVTRALLGATVVLSLLAPALPFGVWERLVSPAWSRPWTLALANLVAATPGELLTAVVLLWKGGDFFRGCLSGAEVAGLYLGCGTLGQVVVAGFGLLPSELPPLTAGPSVGFAAAALLVAFAHFNARQQLSLFAGLIQIEAQHLIPLYLLFQVSVAQLYLTSGAAPLAGPPAGKFVSVLAAWAYLRRGDLRPQRFRAAMA